MERRLPLDQNDLTKLCTIRIWDVRSGQCENTLKDQDDHVKGVVFSPDGTKIASGSNDKTIRIWDVRSGQCENILKGHDQGVKSVAFSTDGTKIVSGSKEKTIRIWDVRSGQCENTYSQRSG
eukprot:TRINITY_DN140_c0_g1_i2.p1 TRINITY_DN140_c0_g1~~TRINITY_DN140_c0_g1_i2.p1  ORF type:complete len:139 (+),score=34.89 TRINITY_DN140_c0_g1_i2:54-419(+)